MKRWGRVAAMLLLPLAVVAETAVEFGRVENFPNMGISLPLLRHSRADPLPMPEATPLLVKLNGELLHEDRFDVHELWYGTQCCGRWHDSSGNQLIVGRVTHHVPQLGDNLVTRDRFVAALQDGGLEVNPRERDEVSEWVAEFAGCELGVPEKRRINGVALDEVLVYRAPEPEYVIYAFRPRRVGNAAAQNWFCAILYAPGSSGQAELESWFEEHFVSAITLPSRARSGEGAKAGELEEGKRGDSGGDLLLDEHHVRREARKSVANYSGWWVAESEGYIILSDVASEVGRSLVRDLRREMPLMLQAYERLVPPFRRGDEVSLIRIFQSKDEYVRFVGPAHAWTSGVWMPARRELVLSQESHNEEMMRIIRHEAFHQYLSHAYAMVTASPWMNEGHACLFENAHVDSKGRVELPEDPERCPFLLEHLELAVEYLPTFLRLDYAQFYADNPMQRKLNYALAWGVCYYLQKGAPSERNTPFGLILESYAAALASETNFLRATEVAFGEVDMGVFQSNFREFWLKRRGAAMQYDPLR